MTNFQYYTQSPEKLTEFLLKYKLDLYKGIKLEDNFKYESERDLAKFKIEQFLKSNHSDTTSAENIIEGLDQ